MSERTEAIWARMPESDRAIVRTAPPDQRDRWIELWQAAQEYEARRIARVHPEQREGAEQDRLDEALLAKVERGEYGQDARQAVLECTRQMTPGTSRRAFLRAARRAVAASRRGKS